MLRSWYAAAAALLALLIPAGPIGAQEGDPARVVETVETTDGRRLRLFADGRYEFVAPEMEDAAQPEASDGRQSFSLAEILARPGPPPGQRAALVTTVRLLGGRALAVDAGLPGQGLALGLDRLAVEDRARIIRDCGLEGCRLALEGRIGRDARGPYLDVTTSCG
ncbi:MAG: hypothetical protein AAF321_09645 [Pseudomonadota bacterium]